MEPVGGRATGAPVGTKTPRVAIDEVSKWVWDGTNDLDRVVVDNLEKLAGSRGVSMAQMALAWMLGKQYITAPIVGTTAVQHVAEVVAALDIELSDDEFRALEGPYVTHPVLGML